jgi:hypothetical protein
MMNVKGIKILNVGRDGLFTRPIKELLMRFLNIALQFSRDGRQHRPLNCAVSSDK